MSRGGGWLLAGILCIGGSLCAGQMIGRAAVDAIKSSRGPGEAFEQVQQLSPFATIANLAFYGGIIAVIVGIILLLVDSSRPSDTPPPPHYPPPPPSPGPSATEEENQRLREELERLKRQQENQ